MAPTLEIFEKATEQTTKAHVPSPIVIEHQCGFTTTVPSIPLPEHEGDKVTLYPDEEGSVTINNCEVQSFTLKYAGDLPESKEAISSQL